MSTGEDIWLSLRCHQKETPHCCQATSVMFSDACSDSTHAGCHLLCLLLTTILSHSQTEWASPPECRSPLSPPIIPPTWSGGLWHWRHLNLFKFWRNHNFKIKFFHSRWPVSLTLAHFFFSLWIFGSSIQSTWTESTFLLNIMIQQSFTPYSVLLWVSKLVLDKHTPPLSLSLSHTHTHVCQQHSSV